MRKIYIPDNLAALNANCKSPLYAVGGFVRNSLKGMPLSDIDLCGPLPANKLIIDSAFKIIPVNPKLGTVVITDGKSTFEYTPFRIENYTRGGAHTPQSVYFTTDISKDSLRRDFTCNSVYYDLKNDTFIDLHGGIRDIEQGIVRELPFPAKVFSSDGLRLMRLARIAAQTGFAVDPATLESARRFSFLLRDVSKERIAQELNKILTADFAYGVSDAHYRGLKLLGEIGLWRNIIAGIEEMKGVVQNPDYHKYDVYEHTMQTVRCAPVAVRLAALMHDIGKPASIAKFGNMHAHAALGEKMTKFSLGPYGLKYSNNIVSETTWLVANHMYDFDGKTSDSKVRIFVASNIKHIDMLVRLIKADIAGGGISEPPKEHRFERVKEEILRDGTPTSLEMLKVNGHDAVRAGIPTAEIGRVLESFLRECMINPKLNNAEWLQGQLAKEAARAAAKTAAPAETKEESR